MKPKTSKTKKRTKAGQTASLRSGDLLAGKRPLPDAVKEIMCECARIQYGMIRDAGWCVTCYRERAVETARCPECQAKYTAAQERRNRAAGRKPWQAGQRGRPPKGANLSSANQSITNTPK